MLDACASYLQRHVLDVLPAPVLRVALDLGLASLEEHIEADFLQVWRKGSTACRCGASWGFEVYTCLLGGGGWAGGGTLGSRPPWDAPRALDCSISRGLSSLPALPGRSFTS